MAAGQVWKRHVAGCPGAPRGRGKDRTPEDTAACSCGKRIRYVARLDLGHMFDPETRTRPRRQIRETFTTKGAAQRWLDRQLADAQLGREVLPCRVSTGEYLMDWLEGRRQDLRPGTWDSYSRMIERHWLPAISGIPLKDLRPRHLRVVYEAKLEAGLSRKTVSYLAGIIHRALQAAVVADPPLLGTNPAARAEVPRLANRQHTDDDEREGPMAWDVADQRRFLELTADERLRPVWHLALATGARRGELLGARWADIDLEAGTWTVKRSLTTVRHVPTFQAPKTDRGRRTIPLDAGTMAMLKALRRRQAEDQLAAEAWEDTDLVFTAPDGGALHPEAVAKVFGRRVARHRLPRIPFHGLRHSHAVALLTDGIPIHIVSARLGHEDASFTARIYARWVPESQHQLAAEATGRLLGGLA
jgi:integrase